MNRGNRQSGLVLAAVGAALLLVSLWLDWYKLPGFTISAWSAFEVWDLVLAGIAVAVILTAATDMGWWRGPTHTVGVLVLGIAAVVIVASQLINRPPSALHSAIGGGGWLALAGAALMALGALVAESHLALAWGSGSGAGVGAGIGARGRGPLAGRRRATPPGAPSAGVPLGRRREAAPRYEDDSDLGPPPV
ncbi:MAG: hypothetical protein LC720_04675 [Actinobacteria bacterium]|nr:hypothetical protein [Actinomycetota bacterium]